MAELIEFETERLFLRQWKLSDREPFALLNADPKVMEFFPAVLDRTTSDAMAQRCQSLIDERGWGFWAAELKETGQFMGFVGLHVPTAQLPFSPCVEIGWRLHHAYWHKGYATEAANGTLGVGFDILAFPEIVSFTALSNAKSQAIMKRIGMHAMPDTFEHPSVPEGHKLREHCWYKLSCTQWRDKNLPISYKRIFEGRR